MAPIRLNWRMRRKKQIHSCGYIRDITRKEREEHKKKFSENKEIGKSALGKLHGKNLSRIYYL